MIFISSIKKNAIEKYKEIASIDKMPVVFFIFAIECRPKCIQPIIDFWVSTRQCKTIDKSNDYDEMSNIKMHKMKWIRLERAQCEKRKRNAVDNTICSLFLCYFVVLIDLIWFVDHCMVDSPSFATHKYISHCLCSSRWNSFVVQCIPFWCFVASYAFDAFNLLSAVLAHLFLPLSKCTHVSVIVFFRFGRILCSFAFNYFTDFDSFPRAHTHTHSIWNEKRANEAKNRGHERDAKTSTEQHNHLSARIICSCAVYSFYFSFHCLFLFLSLSCIDRIIHFDGFLNALLHASKSICICIFL